MSTNFIIFKAKVLLKFASFFGAESHLAPNLRSVNCATIHQGDIFRQFGRYVVALRNPRNYRCTFHITTTDGKQYSTESQNQADMASAKGCMVKEELFNTPCDLCHLNCDIDGDRIPCPTSCNHLHYFHIIHKSEQNV